jgi:tritrans,polycis-undecaprenyl-diphosphate synthase [geranylgeranyl-diphosphate specific]
MMQLLESLYLSYLLRGCRHIPAHIAFIQDGNRRYAEKMGLPREIGHKVGADRTGQVLDWAHEAGIQHLTLYTFSTENFNRTPDELEELFSLFKERLQLIVEDERIHKYRIHIQMIGDKEKLPSDILEIIHNAESATAHYSNYHVNIALAYGGQNEIVQAGKRIFGDITAHELSVEEITPELIETYLYGANKSIPPVDLIIRTGDDCRTSNFLPWLANGYEAAVYFCKPYWPLFKKSDLFKAIREYSNLCEMRERKKRSNASI